MPFTYNGIGTRYHGKSNLEIRPGTCRSCGRQVQLQSYDTRLWFVILYIPIIPLGRKRILDFCPACRRHYASDLDKWETARQLEVSGAMDKYRSNPTPENAIAAHQQFLAFHQVPEATEFQKEMLAKFPDSAKIHAYLGSALDHIGRHDQAAESYKRALELRPDLPEARIGIARGYIRAGKLEEARRLLDFLEKSGSAQLYSLEPLETLAHAYQSREQHREALDLFEKLMRELPQIAEHPAFRKAVKKSEKALGQGGTILPKQKFSLKRLFQSKGRSGRPIATARSLLVLGSLAALVVLGFGISNEYIRHHREIYLVNGYDTPATVQIAGVGEVRDFSRIATLSSPEGHFHAIISGPVKEELDFDLRDGYFDRWFGNPVWVINVGGGGLLELKEALYSKDPQPPAISFYLGQSFQEFPQVTHPFKPLPESVQVESGSTRTLVQLDLFKGDPTDVFAYYEKKKGIDQGLAFAETWLRAHPDDDSMLLSYETAGERAERNDRVDGFLRAGLTNRPLQIAWHRAYQNLHDSPAGHAVLVNQYDDMLQADPTNSALLYLRGRIETNRTLARDYLTRASASDPRNAYAAFALGYDRMAAGDWRAARPFLARAAKLEPHDTGFANLLFLNRLALGEAPAVEQESRKILMRDPLDYLAEFQLIDALATQEKPDQALMAAENFSALCKNRYGESGEDLANAVLFHACYAIGDFDKLKSAAALSHSASRGVVTAMVLIEQGQPDEAVKVLPADLDSDDKELFYFALSIDYTEKGDQTAAALWRSRAVDILQHGSEDEAEAAALLTQSGPPTRVASENVAIPPALKSVILAVLSQQYPQARTELAGFAREMNVGCNFPSQLVRRVTAEKP